MSSLQSCISDRGPASTRYLWARSKLEAHTCCCVRGGDGTNGGAHADFAKNFPFCLHLFPREPPITAAVDNEASTRNYKAISNLTLILHPSLG
ncbi:hypothetical protein IAQ61_003069 [Plenodomus lingam]|uniref:uncharacterized protein n=1 Tax=Leptosphaeria maculans TaxID=5022 RepID=UPI003319327D|nr:hypothetical protein IAQ61_003069 [Plenodomus lingam]